VCSRLVVEIIGFLLDFTCPEYGSLASKTRITPVYLELLG
jgi:hypothetical protein